MTIEPRNVGTLSASKKIKACRRQERIPWRQPIARLMQRASVRDAELVANINASEFFDDDEVF
ncbi:hypothetical protein WN72_09495 [Bradyrhizobium arachidis]|uniref:Uncharacterized protein n=1 Tax=Bradyrhizobium arachidis TaxID=858423 RepID=A0AAE7NI57_9BRAD|nr:hypothetical protein WN72_09495 [Bradyrhizobium arachidis]